MKIKIKDRLPFVEVKLLHGDKQMSLANVLVDTGSGATLISADIALSFGLQPELEDTIYRVHGVGGSEFVYEKSIDRIEVGEIIMEDFKLQIGAMDYGFEIDGILGVDFLIANDVVLDLGKLILYTDNEESRC